MNSRKMDVLSHLIRLLFIGLTMFVSPAFAQIYHVKDMNTEQIKALDREKTVVLLPGGILEEHGPYLPSFSDGYSAKRRTEDLANAIVERPRWKALIFPLIPLGSVGANILGQKYVFPGSYTVRPSTLRAIFIDPGNGARRAGLSLDLCGAVARRPGSQSGSQSGRRLLSRQLRRHMIICGRSFDLSSGPTRAAKKNNETSMPG